MTRVDVIRRDLMKDLQYVVREELQRRRRYTRKQRTRYAPHDVCLIYIRTRCTMAVRLFKAFLVLALISLALPAFAQSPALSTLDEKAVRGLMLIVTRSNVQEGVQLLDEAATGGSDEAKYRLGWLYMQDVVGAPDNDRAFEYLSEVKGEFKTGASILIGVIYAQGSKNIPVNRETTERIFGEVADILHDELRKFAALPAPASPSDMRARMMMYENSVTLRGYADKYGIKLKGWQK